MPVRVMKHGPKFRVIESNGNIAKNSSGSALDGGGHSTKNAAVKQVQAVNISLQKRKKK